MADVGVDEMMLILACAGGGKCYECWVRTIGIGVWIQMQCSLGTEECPNRSLPFFPLTI